MTMHGMVRPQHSQLLSDLGVPHGITTRTTALPDDGDVSFVTAPASARANRQVWWRALGLPLERTVCAQQVHGNAIACVDERDAGRGAWCYEEAIPGVDGLIVTAPGIPVAVFCADCLPILLYAPHRPLAAAIHAGWRGITRGVVVRTLEILLKRYTVQPRDLVAVLGPAISSCCYVVGEEVITAWRALGFANWEAAVEWQDGQWRFDLRQAAQLVLQAYGVPAKQIECVGGCTACHPDLWFSHRRSVGHEGRFAAVIMIPAMTE